MTDRHDLSSESWLEKADGDIAEKRWIPGRGEPQETFMEHVRRCSVVNPLTGCWNWTKSKTNSGYAIYMRKRRKYRVSRAILGLLNEPHIYACHTCDNPSCVNPDHLFSGTHKDNMRDAARKGRTHKGGAPSHKARTAKLSYDEADQITYLYAHTPLTQVQLSHLYGVCQSQVSMIISGKCWCAGSADSLRVLHEVMEEEPNG